MPPVAEAGGGGGGWTCGAPRARHHYHYRERLRRNLGFLAHIRTAACGVASSCRALLRRQRQQFARAPRATSRWRGGAKQRALAPSEWPALARGTSGSSRERPDSRGVCVLVDRRERTTTATARSRAARDEQMAPRRQADSPRTSRWACARGASSSSRETRRPRVRRPRPTRDNDDSGSSRCEQMAPCRGANEAALAPRKGLAQGRTFLYGTSRTSGRPRSTWRPAACVTTTPIKRNQTAAARAPQAATVEEIITGVSL